MVILPATIKLVQLHEKPHLRRLATETTLKVTQRYDTNTYK